MRGGGPYCIVSSGHTSQCAPNKIHAHLLVIIINLTIITILVIITAIITNIMIILK